MNFKRESAIFGQITEDINNNKYFPKICFHCDSKAEIVDAHSISNAQYLNRIAENGQVQSINCGKNLGISLKKKGHNKASTFTGFCRSCDNFIFKEIDNKQYPNKNYKKQEFLFFYRIIAREWHASIGGLESEKYVFKELVKNDISNNNYIAQSMISDQEIGVERIKQYRIALNKNLEKARWDRISTEVVTLKKEYPILVASYFELEKDIHGNILNSSVVELKNGQFQRLKYLGKGISLTIFPQNGNTVIIISFFTKDKGYFQWVQDLQLYSQKELKMYISDLIAKYCENFFIKPSYWNNMPKDIKEKFLENFKENVTPKVGTSYQFYSDINLFLDF